MDDTSGDPLLYEIRDGIGFVTLNRPQARNALTFPMYERLREIALGAAEDASLKAIVITGAGEKAFAAGTDISQFSNFRTPEDALAYEERIDRVLVALEECPKPTIAAISGAATGGGAAIAAVCDIRLGAANLRIGFPIAKTLGNCLSMANYGRLAALIGPARVLDLIYTARLIEAEEAKAIGLVSELLPDHAALQSRAEALARTIAGHAPLTLRATKEAMRRLRLAARQVNGDDLVTMCFTSNDFRQGVEAFLAKRPMVWTGS
ncbi:enoyl-CoA hydratase [Siccirubricoccus deserti]|uniref:Enoyl-CoA hydratase/isomerase family protein n=1 Tax=Siccirubricoccus deserti TaxID=2013562 RepID=A0A9X0UC11_9PROT|nr:enoyl-CoA hydratase [Siccirubricoccus deserti]MBC4013873.1 enoyl-CoA hydratase/isomerase family protein [Siccirubricoccus deserti]GGC30194.1 enoyl-CoA hydratase [Siccirubricoccus deserti]